MRLRRHCGYNHREDTGSLDSMPSMIKHEADCYPSAAVSRKLLRMNGFRMAPRRHAHVAANKNS